MKTRPNPAQSVSKSRETGRQLIRLAVAAACFPATGWAAPKGGEVVQGTGTITQNGSQTFIRAGNKSIIQYSGFDIARGESVRFIQPGKDATVLNRVLSNDPTRIFGQIQANGKVYIVNPFGIYFQNGSMINVGGLYTASGKLSNADFTAGKNNFTDLSGAVVNRGIIKARTGDVVMAGTTVTNTGYIKAERETVVMSSGKDVLIGERDGSVFVQASGQKATPPKLASGDIFSMAVVNSGVIRAKNIQLAGGSGKVTVSGKLDASSQRNSGGKIEISGRNIGLYNAQLKAIGRNLGGTILVGGDYQGGGNVPHAERVFIDKKSSLRADSYTYDGGKVVVWSDGTTIFQGYISALGGLSGDGGMAEVSGKGMLSYEGLTNLTSPRGLTGTLLLDPTDITLLPGDNAPVTGAFAEGNPNTFSGSAATSTLYIGTGTGDTNSTLLKQIATANVVVQTTSAQAGTGNITVNGAISYTSPNSLTLLADNNINVNFAIQNAANGAISLTAANAINLAANLSTTGSISLTHGGAITQTAGLVAANTLNLTGGGAVDLDTTVANLVLAETGSAVVINETDSLSVRGSNTGSLNLTTAGAITQSDTLTVGGSTTLNAGATNDIVLDNVGNDFSNLATITGNNVTLVDKNAITIGNGLILPLADVTATAFNVRSGAGGTGNLSFAFGTAIQANTQSYRAGDGLGGGGAVSAVDLSTNTPLFRNTAGSSSPATFTQRQDAAIADADIAGGLQFLGVPTNYQLTSDEATVTIATGSKVAGSNLGVTAQTDISISGDLSLATLNANSNGSIQLGANIIATGTVSLTHLGDLSRTAGTITAPVLNLVGSGNVGTGVGANILTTNVGNIEFNKSGGATFITETDGVQISGSTNGNLTLSSGTLTQSGALLIGGTTNLNSGASSITLDNAGNDFTGAVTLQNSGAFDVTLRDSNALSIGGMTLGSGSLTINAVGITQTGAITQALAAGAVSIIGNNGEVLLGNAGNDFTGAVTLTNSGAGNVSLTDANALAIAGITVGNGTISLNAVGLSQTGAISQAGGAGAVTITGNAGPVILDNAANDFTGAVALTNSGANNVSLRDVNALSISAMGVGSGTLSINAVGLTQTGAIIQQAGAGAVAIIGNNGEVLLGNAGNDFTGAVTLTNSGVGNVSLTDANSLAITGITVGSGTLSLNAVGLSQTGAINQVAGAGAVTITGNAGAVILNNAGNDFTGGVTLTNSGANNVALRDANALLISGMTLGNGTLDITANGDGITQTGAITQAAGAGAVAIAGNAGDIVLTNPANDFTGVVSLSNNPGNSISLVDSNALILGNVTTSFLSLQSGASGTGNLTFAPASTIQADDQILRAGDGIGGAGISSVVDALTNAPSFLNTAGTAEPTNFTVRQDGAIVDANLPTLAQFGGVAPLNYTLQSDDASLTISTPGKVDGSNLTLQAATSINLDAAISVISLVATAPTINLSGATLDSIGDQTYNGAINLLQDVILSSTGGGAIRFNSTIDTAAGAADFRNLTVNTSGTTFFGNGGSDNVGSSRALASLTTDAPGNTVFNISGGTQSVLTTSAQIYGDAVTLVQDTILSSNGLGDIRFNNTLDTDASATGLRSLIVNTGGSTVFGNGEADNVGANRVLASLTTDAPGSTVFNILGGVQSVLTGGNQTYGDAVTLVQDTILTSNTGAAISLNGTVNTDAAATGFRNLTVNTSGVTNFGNTVGATRALATLTTDLGGSTILNILGGAQSVLTNGAQNYGDAVVLAQNTILTSNTSGVTFSSTINSQTAGNERSLTVNVPGSTTFNGLVGGSIALLSLTTDAPGSSTSGGVTTTGATTFNDATTLGGTYANTGFTAAQSTFLASTTTINSGAGGATFGGTLDGAQGLIVNSSGLTLFSGQVGSLTPLLSLTTNAAGSTTINGGLVATTGFQSYGDSVTVGGPATNFTATNLTFGQTLDGASAVTINSTGATNFNGIVGGSFALQSLVTDAAGTTAINGGAITTSGLQTYNDAVTLLQNTVLTSNAGSNISLFSTVDTDNAAGNFRTLAINTSGSTIFGNGGADTIGASRALQSLTTNAGGNTIFNILGGASSVQTVANQSYGDAVVLASDTILTSINGDIAFALTLDSLAPGSPSSLVVNSQGNTTFGGAVGSLARLDTLTTDAPGLTRVNGGLVTTRGFQLYQDDVTLLENTVFASTGNITFASTLNTDAAAAASRNLTVNTGGTTTFGENVGNAQTIGRLITDAPGRTFIAPGTTVRTSGSQTYNDAVVAAATFTSLGTGSAGEIRFASTLDGVSGNYNNLFVNTAGATIFADVVGGITPFSTVDTDSPGTSRSVGVLATGSVAFNDNTTLEGVYRSGAFLARKTTNLSGNTRIIAKGGLDFFGTINGQFSLLINSPSSAEFRSEVGNLIPLRSLTTDSPGSTVISGGLVVTSGSQQYGDDVTLLKNTILQSNGKGNISLNKGGVGNFRLTVNTAGDTIFGASVALQSLTTNIDGSTIFNGGSNGGSGTVQTTGDQTYNDAVILDKNSRFASSGGGEIAFLGSVDSGKASADLSVETSGITRFAGDVGQERSLQSLTTDAAGSTILSGATIETSGEQLYQDAVDVDGANELSAGTALFKKNITGDTLNVSSTDGVLTFSAPINLKNLTASAKGGDLFIPDATTSGNLNLSSAQFIHLNGSNYAAGGSILFNAENPVDPQTPFSTIVAENGDLTIDAGKDFSMALHQRFFVTNGSLTINANIATLGDTAASQTLTVNANSAVLLGREKLTSGQRQGDNDLGLSFVARTIIFNAPLSYSDQSERQLANFSVQKGQPLVAKIIGVTLFEDVNISDQFLIDGFPIYQPVAGGVSQAEVAETIAGALSRKRDDKVAEDDNLSDEDVKKLGEIGVFSRFYDGTQDLSLEKQFLYYQRDAFQNPKVPANYKVVTRRLQRELVTEVLEQSSKVNDMLPACQAAIDKLQAEFKTTEAYTSEQAFLPYLETKLGTDEGKVIKNTLVELKVLFGKLPLLNLTNKEIDLAKNAISGRFPPTNLNSETDIALKRLLIENKQPAKAKPVEKMPVETVKPPKVASR